MYFIHAQGNRVPMCQTKNEKLDMLPKHPGRGAEALEDVLEVSSRRATLLPSPKCTPPPFLSLRSRGIP